jgi:hypothetical protein
MMQVVSLEHLQQGAIIWRCKTNFARAAPKTPTPDALFCSVGGPLKIAPAAEALFCSARETHFDLN